MSRDEVRALDPGEVWSLWKRGVPCTIAGCVQPPTHVRTWRTAVMPAAAYDYLCAEHALGRQQRVAP